MSHPLADPALTAQFQFDQDHAAYIQTLVDLTRATANLVAAHGECRGLAAMTAWLIDQYRDPDALPGLAGLLAVALHHTTQHPPAGV